MKNDKILVSSITHAIRGRDLLRAHGFKAYIERAKGALEQNGCGYSIYVEQDTEAAERLLREHRVRVLGRTGGGS